MDPRVAARTLSDQPVGAAGTSTVIWEADIDFAVCVRQRGALPNRGGTAEACFRPGRGAVFLFGWRTGRRWPGGSPACGR